MPVMTVLPDAFSAQDSVRKLAEQTLYSTRALIAGAELHRLLPDDEIASCQTIVDRCLTALSKSGRPGAVIEPEFYTWYFNAVQILERGQLGTFARHLRQLPFVACLPLALAGELEVPLSAVISQSGQVVFSSRYPVFTFTPDATVQMSATGNRLVIRSGDDVMDIDWRSLYERGRIALPSGRLVLQQSGFARVHEIEKYEEHLASVTQDACNFNILPPEEFADGARRHVQLVKLDSALDLIADTWSELYDEVLSLTSSITMLEGNPFIGGSDIVCFGASFFDLDPEWSVLAYADHVIHEAAHQRFHAEFESEPALLNPTSTQAPSPIRRDPRPLEGSLHATFVFMRLTQFMERIVGSDVSLDATSRLHRHFLGFQTGIDTLNTYAEFTERGKIFFEHMVQELDRMNTALPQPDPNVYNQIAVDYEKPMLLKSALQD